MAGITRINITDVVNGAGVHRFRRSRLYHPAANQLYRRIFEFIGVPLEEGEVEIKVSKAEYQARLDSELGIDVQLRFIGGASATLQEKFLHTTFDTVTVEYYQDWRTEELGDWFNLKATYYFVGYTTTKPLAFRRAVLLDWPAIQRLSSTGQIPWETKPNNFDGAKASFRYAAFDAIPSAAKVAEWHNGQLSVRRSFGESLR